MPVGRGKSLGLVLVLAIALVLPLAISSYNIGLVSLALMYSIAAMGQTVLTGTANQPSLGNSAFLLIGAYGSATLMTDAHLPLLIAAICTVAIATLIGILIGLPAVRISGVYLAVATIALVFVVIEILTEWDTILGRASVAVIRPAWLGSDRSLYYLTVAVAVGVTLLLVNLLRSKYGQGWAAIRESEVAAASVGIRRSLYKTMAFSTAAAVTAVAGVLLAEYDQAVTPSSFGLPLSLSLLSMAVIGGLGSIPGAYIGAFLITLLPNALGALPARVGAIQLHSSSFATLVSAALLVLVLLFLPGGLWSLLDRTAKVVTSQVGGRFEPHPA